MTLASFVERANAHVRARKPDAAEPHDLLTEQEVVGVRLYTGPAYQMINGWLRRVGGLETSAERRQAALDKTSSYGATVSHIIAAVRKLAAVNTPEENNAKLYRGLRGVLQPGFWTPDEQGLVCATDTAFMSTSTAEATPVHYMASGGKPNLLWELRARCPDDAGYHCGADVSMLSQFAGEREGEAQGFEDDDSSTP